MSLPPDVQTERLLHLVRLAVAWYRAGYAVVATPSLETAKAEGMAEGLLRAEIGWAIDNRLPGTEDDDGEQLVRTSIGLEIIRPSRTAGGITWPGLNNALPGAPVLDGIFDQPHHAARLRFVLTSGECQQSGLLQACPWCGSGIGAACTFESVEDLAR